MSKSKRSNKYSIKEIPFYSNYVVLIDDEHFSFKDKLDAISFIKQYRTNVNEIRSISFYRVDFFPLTTNFS